MSVNVSPDLTTDPITDLNTGVINVRHAQLFELLRQKNISEGTSVRLNARHVSRARTGLAKIDQENAAMLCSLAINSWGNPTEPVRG